MDGYHSAVRYYLNNFADGYRQDAINLFLGHYSIFKEQTGDPKLPLPTRDATFRNDADRLRARFMPLFFAFATSMSALCILYPAGGWGSCFRLIHLKRPTANPLKST